MAKKSMPLFFLRFEICAKICSQFNEGVPALLSQILSCLAPLVRVLSFHSQLSGPILSFWFDIRRENNNKCYRALQNCPYLAFFVKNCLILILSEIYSPNLIWKNYGILSYSSILYFNLPNKRRASLNHFQPISHRVVLIWHLFTIFA